VGTVGSNEHCTVPGTTIQRATSNDSRHEQKNSCVAIERARATWIHFPRRAEAWLHEVAIDPKGGGRSARPADTDTLWLEVAQTRQSFGSPGQNSRIHLRRHVPSQIGRPRTPIERALILDSSSHVRPVRQAAVWGTQPVSLRRAYSAGMCSHDCAGHNGRIAAMRLAPTRLGGEIVEHPVDHGLTGPLK
jgi:hypothetical protein